MLDKSTSCAGELRKMADSCRRFADGVTSPGLARQLEEIASDYERDADRFEARQLSSIRSSYLTGGEHPRGQ